jgi:hypothetical protein
MRISVVCRIEDIREYRRCLHRAADTSPLLGMQGSCNWTRHLRYTVRCFASRGDVRVLT